LILSGACIVRSDPGESVRVVDTHAEAVAQSVAWEGARDAYRGRILRLTEERDKAIRERESLREQLESVACRAAAAETALEAAPAARGGGEGEPVAWGVRPVQSMEVPPGCASPRRVDRQTLTLFPVQNNAEAAAQRSGGTVVPLYDQPPQPRGWLTGQEREAIMFLIANRSQFLPQTPYEERRNAASLVCHDILARSTPPEVVRPKRWDDMRSVIGDQRDAEWIAALDAAGVEVKEVGRE
jgi:hypothetical protein